MFGQLNAEEGITIILVTHDAGIARHAQRVIHIHDGMIEDGTGADEPQGAQAPRAAPGAQPPRRPEASP